MKRELTKNERKILIKLLTTEVFDGSQALVEQLNVCKAIPTSDADGYGSIKLVSESKNRSNVDQRVPVEGVFIDEDNVNVSILLHVVEGFIDELEIFKVDGSKLLTNIIPDEIKVIVNESL